MPRRSQCPTSWVWQDDAVGVVPDTVYRSTTDREPLPVYYFPLSQNYEAAVTRHVRTDDDPMALLPAVRRIVSEVDPRVALVRPQRLEDEFSRSLVEERTMVRFVEASAPLRCCSRLLGCTA
jgi:hypothetical protein